MEIINCLERKDGIKYAIIPKKSNIKKGEKILVTNNLKLINKFIEEEKNEKRR